MLGDSARIYYVVFRWDLYKDDLLSIFNIRQGGLAIYGGVIAAIITTFVFAKVRKLSFPLLCDNGGAWTDTGTGDWQMGKLLQQGGIWRLL